MDICGQVDPPQRIAHSDGYVACHLGAPLEQPDLALRSPRTGVA
jgi:hypothetical protein